MGFLTLAGAISGAGEGAQRGLQTMQAGMIQDHLESKREEFDAARQQLIFNNEAARDDKRMQFESGQNQQKLGADIVTNAQNRAAHSADTESTNQTQRDIHEATNTTQRDIHGDKNLHDKEVKEGDWKLAQDQLAEQIRHNKQWEQRAMGRGTAVEHLDPKLKAQLDVLGDEAKDLSHSSEKLVELAGKVEDPEAARLYRQQAQEKIRRLEQVNAQRRAIIGVDLPAPTGKDTSGFVDPIGASPLGSGAGAPGTVAAADTAAPKAAPAPKGLIHSVERVRPSQSRAGNVAPEKVASIAAGQLDYDIQMKTEELAAAKKHANKSRVAYLQSELDALEIRKAASTEGK